VIPVSWNHPIMAKTRRLAITLTMLATIPGPAAAQPASAWASAIGPAPGSPRSIGGTGAGCLVGAVPLPPDGPGWQAVRLARNRHWGQPALVAAIRDLAGRATRASLPPLLIGDMAQPRGGPLPYGHASHQTGLDVDIWLDVTARPALTAAERENPAIASLVAADGQDVDPARWQPGHATLIRLAAETPGVDRVLVNPAIKRALCRADPGAGWLRAVRPWWGHDSHLHLRLRCPPGQPECRELPPPPPGDGCDPTLDWWFSEAARHPAPRPPGPPAPLPPACAGVLGAR